MSTGFIHVNNLKDSSWHVRNEGFRNVAPAPKNCITKIIYGLELFAIAVNIFRKTFSIEFKSGEKAG